MFRQIQTNDFESANIEFLEFWMMDPFLENPISAGGDFYINLGNVSEDILKDSRKSYENGLPIDGSEENIDTTAWEEYPLFRHWLQLLIVVLMQELFRM